MSTHPQARWGRADGHRVQHAWWRSLMAESERSAVCGRVWPRMESALNFDSDAARCERCAARLARMVPRP